MSGYILPSPDVIFHREMQALCLTCGTPLPEDAGGRRTYCNSRCRGIWKAAQEKAARHANPKPRGRPRKKQPGEAL